MQHNLKLVEVCARRVMEQVGVPNALPVWTGRKRPYRFGGGRWWEV
jgi:hypothetical protein